MAKINNPKTSNVKNVKIKDNNITIVFEGAHPDFQFDVKTAFSNLNRTKVAEKFGSSVGDIVSYSNAMASVMVFSEMLKQLPNEDNLSTNPICYWNESISTIDILQPFYFVPQSAIPFGEEVEPSTANIFYSAILYEPQARLRYLKIYTPELLTAGANPDQETVYELTENVGYKDLARFVFQAGSDISNPYRQLFKREVGKSFGFSESFASKLIDAIIGKVEGITPVVEAHPKIVGTPRWGYFLYRFTLQDIETLAKALKETETVLTSEAAKKLIRQVSGTPYGADRVHEFLSNIIELDTNNKSIKNIKFTNFLDRLQTLSRTAGKYDKSMKKANEAIYVGNNEKNTIQKSWEDQLTNIKKLPIFIKASAIYGTANSKKLKEAETLSYNINVHTPAQAPLYISSVKIVRTKETPKDTLTLNLYNQIYEKQENIFLENGKLAMVESTLAEQIQEALAGVEDFSATLSAALEILKGKESDQLGKQFTNEEYVFVKSDREDRLKNALVYFLASIAADAVKNNEIYVEEVANKRVRRSKLVKTKKGKRRRETRNFENLAGPWTLGFVKNKKVVYEPELLALKWGELLSQFTWLVTDQGKVQDFNWNVLQVNKYAHKYHDVTTNITPAELSYVLATDRDEFDNIKNLGSHSLFFGEVYKYPCIFKEKSPDGAVAKAISESLTPQQKQQLVKNILARRNELIEQAFGDSGCVEAVIKSVDTIEDIYDTAMNKGNWAVLAAQTVDRFKCELSKLGGEELKCLASFDAMGTYEKAVDAMETVQNFDERLKKEAERPEFPLANLLFNRKIPGLPTMDWYKCLREFAIAILIKVVIELIINFIKMILAALNVECGADFSSCEQSDVDPNSSTAKPDEEKAKLVAAGLRGSFAQQAATDASIISDALRAITAAAMTDLIEILASKLPVAHFKALLSGNATRDIFQNALTITANALAPIPLTESDFRALIEVIEKHYQQEALLAASFLEATLSRECPPPIYDGTENLDAYKNSIDDLLDFAANAKSTEGAEAKQAAIKDAEDRASAFCEILNGTTALINEINSAPTALAGITEAILSGGITNLISQLRVKPFIDYRTLQLLFVGSLENKPNIDETLTADLALAYNVLYKNYLVEQKLDDQKKPIKSKKEKQYNISFNSETFGDGDAVKTFNKILKEDSFDKEVQQDILELLPPPFSSTQLVGGLYGVGNFSPAMSAVLNGGRELNNANYYYSWFQDIASNFPGPDPRSFPAKYPDFVKKNYPNVPENYPTAPISQYAYKTTVPESGVTAYSYTDGEKTPIKIELKKENMIISLNDGEKTYERPLPGFSEPLLVEDRFDFDEFLSDYGDFWQFLLVKDFEQQLFLALSLKALTKYNILLKTNNVFHWSGMCNFAKESFLKIREAVGPSTEEILNSSTESPILDFFGGAQIFIEKPAKTKNSLAIAAAITKQEEGFNPLSPSTLFFRRSDNIISDVLFEDDIEDEVEKIKEKFKANLKAYASTLADGAPTEPKPLFDKIGNFVESPAVFYEVERLISTEKFYTKDWLSKKQLTKTDQMQILKAIQEVNSE